MAWIDHTFNGKNRVRPCALFISQVTNIMLSEYDLILNCEAPSIVCDLILMMSQRWGWMNEGRYEFEVEHMDTASKSDEEIINTIVFYMLFFNLFF